jgi:VanZ family protein
LSIIKGRSWVPLVAWVLVIFFFSTDNFSGTNTAGLIQSVLKFLFPFLTPSQLHFWHGVCRKAGHVTEYFILGFLAWRTFRAFSWTQARPKLFTAGFVLAVALSDELHQAFVPSRTGSLIDVGYDFAGCLIVLMLLPRSGNGSKNEARTLHSHPVL